MTLRIISVFCVLLISACASNKPPQTTHDGLTLVPNTKFEEVYMSPNASLSGYTEFGLLDCEVAFKKNWLRDQNNSRIDLSNRVTQKDVDKIKDRLAADCTKHIADALAQAPAYNMVESFEEGEAVLVLRPSIINLDINAPDTMSAGMSRTYTTSAGEMTLLLELVDATTGQTVARILDRRRGMDSGHLQWSSGVSNKADADRVLSRWAKLLRTGLDEATSK